MMMLRWLPVAVQRVHCQWQPRAAVAVVPPVPAQRGRSGVFGAECSGGRSESVAAANIWRVINLLNIFPSRRYTAG